MHFGPEDSENVKWAKPNCDGQPIRGQILEILTHEILSQHIHLFAIKELFKIVPDFAKYMADHGQMLPGLGDLGIF